MSFFDKVSDLFSRTDKEEGKRKPASTGPHKAELTPADIERLKRQVETFRDILKVKPEDAATHYKLAQTFMDLERYGDALAPLRETQRLEPDHPSVRYKLAQCLMEKGRDEDAIELIVEAREKNPDSLALKQQLALAHTNLCITYGKLKRLEEAARHFKEAVALIPDFGPAHLAWGKTLLQQGRYDAAISKFEETIKMDPNLLVDCHHSLAQALGKKGEIRRALKHYQEAIKADPKAALVHQGLGEFHFKQGNFEESVASLLNALKMSPKLTGDAWFKLGMGLVKLKRLTEAEEPLRKAYDLTPDNEQVQDALTEVLFCLSKGMLKEGKVVPALDLLREAVRINPTHAQAQFALGQLYDLKQEGRKAIRHLLFAKNYYLEQKNRAGLAQVVKTLEPLYAKYKQKPEDFDDIVIPTRS